MGVDPAPAGRNARRLTGRVAQARDILATLAVLRPALVRIDRPWRIIGSAALVLHAIQDVVARDIDLMLDPDDAAMLIDQAGFVRQPQDDRGPFRSHVHARRDDLTMPVDVMGGFAFRNPDGVHPVRVDAPILHDGWPVASLPDLTAMLRLFDRPKDRLRLSLIANMQRRHAEARRNRPSRAQPKSPAFGLLDFARRDPSTTLGTDG